VKIPAKPDTFEQILPKLGDFDLIRRIATAPEGAVSPAPRGKYYHWDTLRRIRPPQGLTVQEWWAAIKFSRQPTRRAIPLLDRQGQRFFYTMPDPALDMLHTID